MKKVTCWAMLLSLLGGFSLSAHALSEEEILKRLEAYEERIKALEEELKDSQKQSKKAVSRVKSLGKQVQTDKERIRFSGFLSAGATVSNIDEANYLDTIEGNRVNTQKDSIVGIQTDYKISDRSKAVVQLVARGEERDWNINAEWAFIDYEFTENFTMRAGRMRNPRYMVSEYLEVGYSYLWIRPPEEVYNLVSTNSFDGFMALYNPSCSSWDFNFQAYWGRNVNDRDDAEGDFDLNLNDTMGVTALGYWRNWTFRTGYSRADLDLELPTVAFLGSTPGTVTGGSFTNLSNLLAARGEADNFTFNNADAEFMSVGFQYDNGSFVAISEAIKLRVAGYLSDGESHYLTVGYRIGPVTPYATYARYRTIDDGLRAGSSVASVLESTFNEKQKRYSLGLRYDFAPGLAAKVEVSTIDDLEGTRGLFDSANAEEGEIFSIVIDSVF